MVTLRFLLEYPWPEGVERSTVEFRLWSGYGFTNPEEAHAIIAKLLRTNERVTFLDETGAEWEFYASTVRTFWSW